MVGYYQTSSGNNREAVLWSPSGKATVLQDAGGLGQSQVNAINASGQSVGSSEATGSGSAEYPVLWSSSGVATVLQNVGGTPYNNWDEAYDINKYGWSVGISAAPGGIGPSATLWSTSGTGIYLQNPINSSDPSWAVAISNSGYVVGWVQAGGGDSAVLWSPSGTPTLLASGSTVSQVNESGQSIGQIVEDSKLYGAALWSSTGGLTILQGLGSSTYAKAINKYGDVVGMAINGSSGLPEAVIWSPTGNVAVL